MNRSLKNAVRHIKRAPLQAVAAVSVFSITFFLVSIFALVTAGSEKIIRYFETRPQVTAFFKDGISDDKVQQLADSVRQIEGVTAAQYISKSDALKIYREQNKTDPLLLEMVTEEILPASLEVKADNPEVLTRLADLMKSHEAVEEVVYQKNIIDNLLSWTRIIRVSGLVLVSFLLSSSIFMVMIITSIKIANHKSEIEVGRLLGGSKSQVISPFLLEGIIYGLISAFIGWGLAYITLLYSTPLVIQFLGSIPLLPVPIWLMLALLAGQLILGAGIGFFSSLFAARRFLK